VLDPARVSVRRWIRVQLVVRDVVCEEAGDSGQGRLQWRKRVPLSKVRWWPERRRLSPLFVLRWLN
jgi:hypothetical protein